MHLFTQADVDAGLNHVLTRYFNNMYLAGRFVETVQELVQKKSFALEGKMYCDFGGLEKFFPNYIQKVFEGVRIQVIADEFVINTVIVQESTCYTYLRLACDRYLEKHPESADKIKFWLDQIEKN